jgi:hypothetical protein
MNALSEKDNRRSFDSATRRDASCSAQDDTFFAQGGTFSEFGDFATPSLCAVMRVRMGTRLFASGLG